MRLLNKELKNPYLSETPFFEPFEKMLSHFREQPDSVLFRQIDKQTAIFNNPSSDGLMMYEAEEKAYAANVVLAERDERHKASLLSVSPIVSLMLQTPKDWTENPYKAGSTFFSDFEKQVTEKSKLTMEELTLTLKEMTEKYLSLEADAAMTLFEPISLLKCAIIKKQGS